MDVREAPATPTLDFRGVDDTTTFEFFDGSTIQKRKRRRSSLRRVSFAEQPSIHVFARDDDYETPPEGTVSHFSAQSTPTSVSRSPQRRSERLAAARGGQQDDNEVDKENVPVSVGSSVRQSRRGRRPLALRDTQKEREEEFLKPSNWLDDHENLAFGSCDDNTGPVDLRHITFDNQRVAVDDDDMTMDSQTFHTRMSQMLVKQSLHRLSEEKVVDVITPGQYTDMELTVAWPEGQTLERKREVRERSTWHRGDDSISDMSQGSFEEFSIFRVLAKKNCSAKVLDIHDSEDTTVARGNNWKVDNALSQRSMQIKRNGSLLDIDDTLSMETSSPQSNCDRRKLHIGEGEQDSDCNLRDSEGSDGSHLQGTRASNDKELQERRPNILLKTRSPVFDCDDAVSMETTSQSHADGDDSTMEIDSGTDERLLLAGMQTSASLKESEAVPECSVRQSPVHQASEHSVTLDNEDSSERLKQYERKLKRMSKSAAEKDISVSIEPEMITNSQLSGSQRHALSIPGEPLAKPQIGRHEQGLEQQESFSQPIILTKELREALNLQACNGLANHGIEQETILPAPDDGSDSMDITRTWIGCAPQHTSIPTKSSDSAKSFLWVDKDQHMDMSDLDVTEKYQDGITEAMPKWTDVLGVYNCDSPSAEPLSRIVQSKNDVDAEDSPVYGLTAEVGIKRALATKKGDDVARTGEAKEIETVSNRGLEEGTVELHLNIGKKKNVFQNPEDTFSFKGHQKSTRATSVSPSTELNVMPGPTFSNVQVQEKVDIIEANRSNQSGLHNSGQDLQDEDTTGDFTSQHDWRADVSSDMSTTPLSPRRPTYFQRLVAKPETVQVQIGTGLTDSPSLQDGITEAIPNVQDLLAADAGTPESELGWNPRKIVWSAQQSSRQDLGDEEDLRQPRIQVEEETMHSMPDKLCTPRPQQEKNRAFESVREEAAKTLSQVSQSKEVRNSIASKMLLRMMSLQDKGRAQAESSSDGGSQLILRRTLQFQPDGDSQSQSQPLREDTEQQISAEDPDGAMEVESVKNLDEVTDSTESRIESLRQESRRQKLLQEKQEAEERLAALELRSEELREIAQDCHQAVADRCRNDSCFEMKELAAFCSQAHVSKLRKRCQLLNCMQWWDLKTTKTGDDQVLHEFKYWSLLTHSVFERKEKNFEVTVSKSSIDLNEESINQVFRHMNASLAWRWFLSGHEEVVQPQSLFHHVQGVNSKVTMLLDLMEEVNICRKYLVIPHFRLQTGTCLHLGLQFSSSDLLFDFALLLDMGEVIRMSNSKRREPEMTQKLNCVVLMESAGRLFGKKITDEEIMRSVASVVPGHQLLLRICACINTLIRRMKD